MDYQQLALWHLATVMPAFVIASYLLLRKKGTASHKVLGRVYMVLMLATATISLFMPAQLGPALGGHFGFIHLLSVLTLYAVPAAYFYIKKGNVKGHRRSMVLLYCGGFLIAGSFTVMPGRLLNSWLFA